MPSSQDSFLDPVPGDPTIHNPARRSGDSKNANMTPFMNPAVVVSYTAEAPKKVPGLADLHRMTTILLSERAPQGARILAVGAVGGLELKAMAEARPDWQFVGVDPSAPMLDIARQTIAPLADRIELMTGTVDQAPAGPFDGAVCLLTLHFLDRDERLHILKNISSRLRSGGAMVIAHHSAVDGEADRWLARSSAFADHTGFDPNRAATSAKTMTERLPLLTPLEEEEVLSEAGFADPKLFYAAFSFRGWVAHAARKAPMT